MKEGRSRDAPADGGSARGGVDAMASKATGGKISGGKGSSSNGETCSSACELTQKVKATLSDKLTLDDLLGALGALQQHGSTGSPPRALVDVLHAKVKALQSDIVSGRSDLSARMLSEARDLVSPHVRAEAASPPYSLGALHVWVACTLKPRLCTNPNASTFAMIVVCLRDWVDGPFQEPNKHDWVDPLDEWLGTKSAWEEQPLGTTADDRVHDAVNKVKRLYSAAKEKFEIGIFYEKADGLKDRLIELARNAINSEGALQTMVRDSPAWFCMDACRASLIRLTMRDQSGAWRMHAIGHAEVVHVVLYDPLIQFSNQIVHHAAKGSLLFRGLQPVHDYYDECSVNMDEARNFLQKTLGKHPEVRKTVARGLGMTVCDDPPAPPFPASPCLITSLSWPTHPCSHRMGRCPAAALVVPTLEVNVCRVPKHALKLCWRSCLSQRTLSWASSMTF
eukprot:354411-Chlamydomonas_euryale.AAC.9